MITEQVIYTTSEYYKFTYLIKNRNDDRFTKILESFRKHGYINCPITVNENFEIIDGRARFEACRHFQIPVDYIVMQGAGITECYQLNKDKGTWNAEEFKKAKTEIKKSGNDIKYQDLTDNDAIIRLIDEQIRYWIRKKIQLTEKGTKPDKQEIKEQRREYQRRFYERHPEKRAEYANRFYGITAEVTATENEVLDELQKMEKQ